MNRPFYATTMRWLWPTVIVLSVTVWGLAFYGLYKLLQAIL